MNKPVAYIHKTISGWTSTFIHPETEPDEWLPLYTHPIKELTDEEIIEIVKDHFIGAIKVGIVLTNDNVLDFAKAILRKAQEK